MFNGIINQLITGGHHLVQFELLIRAEMSTVYFNIFHNPTTGNPRQQQVGEHRA